MLLRLQVTDKTLAGILRGQFQRQDLCVTDPISSDPNNPTYIDHIVFSGVAPLFAATIFEDGPPKTIAVKRADGSSTNVTYPTLILNRVATLYTTTLNALQAANGAAPATTSIPLPLQLSLSFDHVDTVVNGKRVVSDQLTLAFYRTNPNLGDDVLKNYGLTRAALDAKLKSLLPTISTPLDLTKVFSALGGTFKPVSVWSGIAANSDFSEVEIRVELSSTGALGVVDANAWSSFYNRQNLDDILQGKDWGFFVDKDLVVGIVNALITPAVQSSSTFRLDSGPSCSWNPSLPGVTCTLNGDVINACQCFWGKIDVNTDVTVNVSFSADNGLLHVDLHLDHSSNGWQLFCCELTATLFWPILGFNLVDGNFWGPFEYIGGLICPVGVFIGSIYTASTKKASVPTPSGFTQDPGDSEHFFSDVGVTSTLDSPDDSFSLDSVTGTDAGLIIAGGFTDKNLQPPTISKDVSEFEWGLGDVTCSSLGGAGAHAQVTISRASGAIDFWFCKASVTPAEFQPYLSVSFTYSPYTPTISLDVDKYIADPATIFIQTTGGLRLITLKPMPQLTQSELEGFRRAAKQWQITHCYTLVDGWYRFFHRFNPHWSVDPPAKEGDWSQVWQVVVAGVNPGDQFVVGADGKTVMTGIASPAGAVLLNAGVNASELTIERRPGGDQEGPEGAKVLSTQRQVLLQKVAEIPLSAPALAMQAYGSGRSDQFLVATRAGLENYTIDRHGQWGSGRTWAREELVGAAAVDGRLIAWTIDGALLDLTEVAGRIKSGTTLSQGQLESAAAKGFTHAVSVGGCLIGLHGTRLRNILSGSGVAPPEDEVVTVSRFARESILVRSTSGEYLLYALGLSNKFELSAKYGGQPWFDGLVTLGRWLLTLSEDRRSVRVFAVAAVRNL